MFMALDDGNRDRRMTPYDHVLLADDTRQLIRCENLPK